MSRSALSPWLWPRKLLAGLVQGYRWTLKPWLGNACRFEPSCSAYALEALGRHGAVAGSALTGWRLLRCHPWCNGGLDPVPARFAEAFGPAGDGLFTRLLPGSRPGIEREMLAAPGAAGHGQSARPIASQSIEPSRRGPRRPGEITGDQP
jgi:putative membrane protein insertion efficiency factor